MRLSSGPILRIETSCSLRSSSVNSPAAVLAASLRAGRELPDDGQRDVRFEQGEPDLPQRRLDVKIRQMAFAPELFEDPLHPVAETLEHV